MTAIQRITVWAPLVMATFGSPIAAAPLEASESARARSVAAFEQMYAVLQHPRCLNCHPKGDSPTQGEDRHRHDPAVSRGSTGIPTIDCSTCHQAANSWDGQVPGATPKWELAPPEMRWDGESKGTVCTLVRRVGIDHGRLKGEEITKHLQTGLVLWAWDPGSRSKPPLTYSAFMAFVEEWIANGAVCPNDR